MSRPKNTTLNCFSPPVMVATVVIELTLAAYTFWRYKLDEVSRLVLLLLVTLATFQIAEYNVCTGLDSQSVPWSRLGFIAITALPPLGLHLMHVLADKKDRRLVYGSYAFMVAFMTFFLVARNTFTGHQCTGNYVIFQFSPKVTGVYSIYYYAWLLAGIGLGFKWANELKKQGEKAARKVAAVQGLILGYLIFLVPAAIAMSVKPDARRGIPSVLCGFAVLLALVLALYISPRSAERRA